MTQASLTENFDVISAHESTATVLTIKVIFDHVLHTTLIPGPGLTTPETVVGPMVAGIHMLAHGVMTREPSGTPLALVCWSEMPRGEAVIIPCLPFRRERLVARPAFEMYAPGR